MKTLVNTLASAVRKFPWLVIALTIVISMVLGSFGGQFQPAEDQNESFAPEAPELAASTVIAQRFGAATRLQVLTSSSTGDVITLDAFQAAIALEESVRTGESATFLVDTPQSPAVLSYLAPVQFAIDAGAPAPTSDAEVKELYKLGLTEVPAEFRTFLTALVSDDADFDAATAEIGLSAITYETTDDFDALANRARAVADSVDSAAVPASISLEAFSVELVFASGDDFQQEILRLFLAAGLIILLVLSVVFLVRPRTVRDRRLFVGGIALMVVGALFAVAPSLALIFPNVLPESWGDASAGSVALVSAVCYLAAFLMWSVGSGKLRRTTSDTVLTFLTIGFAIQWMNGYGYLRFADQSQLVQILPILLIGLGVDYSIHLNTRYRQEIHEGRSVDRAVTTAIRTTGIALVLATVTTAVGFLTNVTNDIPALAEFGELAAVGIVVSFLLMLTFVPAVREVLDRRAERLGRLDADSLEGGESRALPRFIGRAAVLPKRFAWATVIATVLLTVLAGISMTNLSTKFSVLDFVPTTSPLRGTAITVDDRFDFPETTSVLVEGDVASGEAWNAMLGSFFAAGLVPNVQAVDTPGGPFPVGQSLTGTILQLVNPDGQTFDPAILAAATDVGLQADQTLPPGADATPLYDAAFAAYPVQMAAVLSTTNGDYDAALFNFDTVGGEPGAGELATDLNAAFAPAASAGLSSVATSSFIINDLVIGTLRDSQVSSLLLTMGAALVLLLANFWFESRRPMLGIITTLPVAIVVIWVFGLMAAFNIAFGPVTATISALGIGIGIPYMIHVTHRYLEERSAYPLADDAIEHTLTYTGGALAGSAITTMAGFGILVTSTTIPFRQFGFVLAYTILLALIAAVLVLPSMLMIWDRWHRSRGEEPFDPAALHDALQDESVAEGVPGA